jgi:hypothetical protein
VVGAGCTCKPPSKFDGRKELDVNTLLNLTWSDVVAVAGSLGVGALMLLLIAYVQLWRHRVHRIRRAVRGAGEAERDVQPEVQSEARLQEYLDNADFSNEGNPNYGWKDRFLERSFN